MVKEWITQGENIHPIEILPQGTELFVFDSARSAYKVDTRIRFNLPYKPEGLFFSMDLSFFVDFDGSLRDANVGGAITNMVEDGELIDFYQGKLAGDRPDRG